MRWPIRRQIMLPVVAVAIISLAAVAGLNAQLAARDTQERLQRQLRGVTSVLATSNFPLTDSVLRQMRSLSGAEFIVTDSAGATLTSSLANRPPQLQIRGGMTSEATPLGRRVELGGTNYFHQATELPQRGGDLPYGRLHVLFPETEYRRAWREAFLPPMVIGALAVAAVSGTITLITGRLSSAMRRMGEEVLRIARGDFTPTPVPARDDEIRDLSLAVNRTAELLTEYSDHVRQAERMRTVSLLGAGLAHEMRNAATGCRIALDLHEETCTAEVESLLVAKRQLQLMESQLQRFLRVGKPAKAGQEREVDLAAIVGDAIRLVRPAARHAGVEVESTDSVQPAIVIADGEALGQAVINVLLNAIEAVQQTAPGGHRLVRTDLQFGRPGFVELVVSDNGPGPRDSLAGALFSPFVTSKPEGVGLGLAVVKGIVEAHRGTINWLRADGITSFRIELPLAKEEVGCV